LNFDMQAGGENMSYQEPKRGTETKDQRQFDEAVNNKGKVVLEWLAGAGILAAVLMSTVALIQSGEHKEVLISSGNTTTPTTSTSAAASKPALQPVSLKIVGAFKPGPDGKRHDAFTTTDFAVHVGQPLTLTIDNTDDVPHSITSPAAGVNITIQPGVHDYKLVVNEAGRFQWFCVIPCDSDAKGWAMEHAGFMAGYITAT
jgi:heme/copper-type cytochrome/quinol oxidase subunit 2